MKLGRIPTTCNKDRSLLPTIKKDTYCEQKRRNLLPAIKKEPTASNKDGSLLPAIKTDRSARVGL